MLDWDFSMTYDTDKNFDIFTIIVLVKYFSQEYIYTFWFYSSSYSISSLVWSWL